MPERTHRGNSRRHPQAKPDTTPPNPQPPKELEECEPTPPEAFIREYGRQAFLRHIIPPALAEAINYGATGGLGCPSFEHINVFLREEGDRTLITVTDVIESDDFFMSEAVLQLNLMDMPRIGGGRELMFSHRLQDISAGVIQEDKLRNAFPGQRYPGLRPQINHQLILRLKSFARGELRYDWLTMIPQHYHVYRMALADGFVLDTADPWAAGNWQRKISEFEDGCRAIELRTVREKSWRAQELGGFITITGGPHLAFSLRDLDEREDG